MRLSTTFLLLLSVISAGLYAQTTEPAPTGERTARTREIGLRAFGLNDVDFIYKKSLDENTYRRYRLASGNLDFLNIDGVSVGTFSIAAAIGKERRKSLADQLDFIYGPEYALSLAAVATDDDFLAVISPRIGYVLGFQYNVSDRFYVGVETIPGISIAYGGGASQIVQFSAGFDSNAVAIVGAYRFVR